MKLFKFLLILILLLAIGCSKHSGKIKTDYTKGDSDFLGNLMNREFMEAETYLAKQEQIYTTMTITEKCKFHFFKGSFLMAKERYAEGEAELNSCLSINPNYVQALYTRANYYHRVKNELVLASSDLQILSSIIDHLVETNKDIRNYESFNVSLFVLHPTPSDEFIAANEGSYINNQPDFVLHSTTINNFRRDIVRAIEDLAVDSGDFPKAIECRLKIIEYYRKYHMQLYTSYHILGNYYYKMDNYPEALEFYEQATSTNDTPNSIHTNIGYCQFKLHSYKDALLNFNRAIKYGERVANIDLNKISKEVESGLTPKKYNMTKETKFLCNALFYKARSLEELDYRDESLETMNQILAIDNKYTNAYYYRGYYHNAFKKYELAVKDFKKAVNLDPNLTQLYYSIAVNYEHMDKPSSAKNYYQLYLAKDKKISSQKHATARERLEEL